MPVNLVAQELVVVVDAEVVSGHVNCGRTQRVARKARGRFVAVISDGCRPVCLMTAKPRRECLTESVGT